MPDDSPYPRPLTAPSLWLPLLEPGAKGESFPGEHWPKLETIDYISKLIILILLLLAMPWLVDRLLTQPSGIPRDSAAILAAKAA